MEALNQEFKFTFQINGGGPSGLKVYRFRGEGKLHGLYSFSIELSSRGLFKPEKIVGKTGVLTVQSSVGGMRNVQTIRVSGAIEKAVNAGRRDAFHFCQVELTSNLKSLERTKRYRFYENQTSNQIIGDVLGDYLEQTTLNDPELPERELCTQYGESDLNFAKRLAEEDGCFLVNNYSSGNVILSQSSTLSRTGKAGDHTTVELERAQVVEGIKGDYYDWLKPAANLSKELGGRGFDGVDYSEFHSRIDKIDNLRGTGVAYQTQVNLDRLQSPGRVYRGESQESDIVEGFTYTINSTQVLVTQAVYEGYNPEVIPKLNQGTQASSEGEGGISLFGNLGKGIDVASEALSGELEDNLKQIGDTISEATGQQSEEEQKDRGYYICHFSAVNIQQNFVPPQRTPKPTVLGTVTTVVENENDEEIDADEHGCVRVRFPWDTESPRGVCRLRCATPWSGGGYGLHFTPRNGQEVLVSFLGGNVDRPVIASMLYNGENLAPWSPQEEASKSGIRTKTVPENPSEESYNELLFDDKAGVELVSLRAQRNFKEEVINDSKTHIGNDSTLTIEGKNSVSIGRKSKRRVTESDQLSIGGDYGVTVGSDSHLSVGGSSVETVSSSVVHVTGSSREEHTNGALTSIISGELKSILEENLSYRIKGEVLEYLEMNLNEVVKGSLLNKVEGEVFEEYVGGLHQKLAENFKVESKGEIVLDVGEGITFKCGSNVLTLDDSAAAFAGSDCQMNSESSEVSAGDVELEEPAAPGYASLLVKGIECSPTEQSELGEMITLTVKELDQTEDDGEESSVNTVDFPGVEKHLQPLVRWEYCYSNKSSPSGNMEWFGIAKELIDPSRGTANITPPEDNGYKHLHFRAYVADSSAEGSCTANLKRKLKVERIKGDKSAKPGSSVTYEAVFNVDDADNDELSAVRWRAVCMVDSSGPNRTPQEEEATDSGAATLNYTIEKNIVRGGVTTVQCWIEGDEAHTVSFTTALDDNRAES